MSYATPTRFRGYGLPPGALEGVLDAALQAHLDPAYRQINRRLRGRNLAVPLTGAAADDLADCECAIAAYTFLTLYRGVPFEDPAVSGYRQMAKDALLEVDDIATGVTNTPAEKVATTGGGLAQGITPDGAPDPDCDPWGMDRLWG